jgi:hypothetical protein
MSFNSCKEGLKYGGRCSKRRLSGPTRGAAAVATAAVVVADQITILAVLANEDRTPAQLQRDREEGIQMQMRRRMWKAGVHCQYTNCSKDDDENERRRRRRRRRRTRRRRTRRNMRRMRRRRRRRRRRCSTHCRVISTLETRVGRRVEAPARTSLSLSVLIAAAACSAVSYSTIPHPLERVGLSCSFITSAYTTVPDV